MPSIDNRSDYLKKLMFILDLALVAVVYVTSVKIYPYLRIGTSIDELVHFGLLPLALIIFGLTRQVLGRYLDIQRQTLRAQTVCIVQEILLTLGALVLIVFLLKLESVSRVVIVTFAVAALAALIFIRRFIVWWYISRPSVATDNLLRVLIVGSGRRARLLADQLARTSEWGVHVIGFLDPRGESAGRRSTDAILGHVDEINQVLRDNVVDDVIVAVPRSMLGDVQAIIDSCQEEGVTLRFMADIYDFKAARTRLHLVSGIPLLSFEPVAQGDNALLAKRIFDLVVTLAAMPVLLPLFAVLAIVIRVDSKGPVIFAQERVGLHKRKFRMYKFRSMVQDAEAKIQELEHLNEATGPNFKIKNDPRITRAGRFIRRTSIDELPQLLNVLAGDMSLVGPRPMSVRDVNLFDQGLQRRRFSVRPGITCLWQVSGRSDLSFDDWLKLDLQYIESWTFWEDLKILLKTIPVVFKGSGAA
jgi:exopolysaccharide biosynthesis polyprenyl glycosylphosphotransferase